MRRMFTKNQLDNEIKAVKKDISTLVDKNGNPRFVEGAFEPNEISGYTWTYSKWSLSGTHLMIVLCGTIASGTSITTGDFAEIELPSYIKDKIVQVFDTFIAIQNVSARDADWTSTEIGISMSKTSNGVKLSQFKTATAPNTNRNFRVQFDLLIDVE